MNFSRQGIAGYHFALHAEPFSYCYILNNTPAILRDATIVTFYRLPLRFSFRNFLHHLDTIIFIWLRLKFELTISPSWFIRCLCNNLILNRYLSYIARRLSILNFTCVWKLRENTMSSRTKSQVIFNVEYKYGTFYGSILPHLGFLTWNIHTRGTNCEDVIPGIAFEPCSRWETVKRRKMHTLGAVLLSFPRASLFNPLCRSFHYLSTTHLVKVYREIFDRIFRPQASWEIQHAPLVRHSCVRVTLANERTRKVVRRGQTRDDTAT